MTKITLEIVSGDDTWGASSVEVQSDDTAQSSATPPMLRGGIPKTKKNSTARANASTAVPAQSTFELTMLGISAQSMPSTNTSKLLFLLVEKLRTASTKMSTMQKCIARQPVSSGARSVVPITRCQTNASIAHQEALQRRFP